MAKNKRLWILFRSGGKLRRFLRIGLGEDGSFYLTLGLGPRKTRIFDGQITIPAGVESASVDFTQSPVANYPKTNSRHTGYKKSGLILEKIGDAYRRSAQQVPESIAAPILLKSVYPGPSSQFLEATQRQGDIVLPGDFDWPRNEMTSETIEELMDGNPYRVEIWRLPQGATNAEVNASVRGAVSLSVGDVSLIIAFCQDATDLARGHLEITKTLVSYVAAIDTKQ